MPTALVHSDDQTVSLDRADLERIIAAVSRLSGLQDSSVIATKAAQEARALADVDLVGIAVVEGVNSIVMMGTAGGTSEWFSHLRMDVDIGVGFAGTILATGLPLFFNTRTVEQGIFSYDAADGAVTELVLSPTYARHLEQRISPERLREYIGVPIELNGQVLGLLYGGNRTRKTSPGRTRVVLARFAAMIAPILMAARRAREAAVAELTREREQIAFSLHDTIGQILYGIGTSAKRCRVLLRDNPESVDAELNAIELESSRAAAHLRAILRTLGDQPAETALDNEVRILAGMFSARSGIPADVIVTGAARAAEPDSLAVLVSVVREGLHNVEKHSAATAVIVTLHYAPDRITVAVQDDGCGVAAGLALAAGLGDGFGLGLASLKRRVERVGGRLFIHRRSDGDTTLRAVV